MRNELYEQIVGRELADSQRGSIPSLNDMPLEVLEIARAMWKLGPNATVSFIWFMVEAINLGDAKVFVEDVVVGGRDPSAWRVEDSLVSPREWLPTDLTRDLFESFENIEGERWYRVVPTYGRHSGFGMVGVLRRNAKCWRPSEFEYRSATLCEYVEPSRVLIAHRRSLANRLGWRANAYLQELGTTAEGVLRTVEDVDLARVTEDAWIASRALIREVRADAPADQRGFVGPDEWYE
jgi:hypothetical protein